MPRLISLLKRLWLKFLVKHPLLVEGSRFIAICVAVAFFMVGCIPTAIIIGLWVPESLLSGYLKGIAVWTAVSIVMVLGIALIEALSDILGYSKRREEE